MRILLIGYGKMGKAIEAAALQRNHSIVGRVDQSHPADFNVAADVAIEFTTPTSAVDNIRQCLDHNIPVVSGTTGWLDQKPELDAYCLKKQGTFFYASNFSVGVNIFYRLNEYLASMMKDHGVYDVSIDETHHTQKKDAPSGTAIALAQGVMKHLLQKKKWSQDGNPSKGDLVIRSFRKDPTPGTHLVRYQSALDDIEIVHTAHSREGFARGAILVAEWLPSRKGVVGMNDFLQF